MGAENIFLISELTGCFLIVASAGLILLKRISLDKVGSNPKLKEQEVKAEILNLLKFSSNIPAMGLFLIGMTLIIIPVLLCPKIEKAYTVKGIIKKENSQDSRDILIASSYPPHHPERDGKLVGFVVTKINDKFPTLSFNHHEYSTAGVDLNDNDDVEISGDIIKLKKDVILKSSD